MPAKLRYIGLDVHKESIVIAVAETGRVACPRASMGMFGRVLPCPPAVAWAPGPCETSDSCSTHGSGSHATVFARST